MECRNTWVPVALLCMLAGCGGGAPAPDTAQRTLIIVEKGRDSVGFYTETGERLGGVPVETIPHEMVLTPDRRYALVTNTGAFRYTDDVEGGRTVSVIDVKERRFVRAIPIAPFRRPHGLAIHDHTGRLLVGTENPDQLLVIDYHSGEMIRHFDVPVQTPHWVTVGPAGKHAYVSGARSANVAVIDLETGATFTIPTGVNPQGSAISKNERELYVACQDYIAVLDIEQRAETGRIPQGANRLELTRDGSLLVYAATDSGVGFADPNTRQVLDYIDLPHMLYSMHLSQDEQLAYVSAEEVDIVYTISVPDRRLLRQFQTPKGTRPDPVYDTEW